MNGWTILFFIVAALTFGFWLGGGNTARLVAFLDWAKLKVRGP